MTGLVSCERYRCGTVGESNSTSYPLFLTADPLAGQSTVDVHCILRAHSRKVDKSLQNVISGSASPVVQFRLLLFAAADFIEVDHAVSIERLRWEESVFAFGKPKFYSPGK